MIELHHLIDDLKGGERPLPSEWLVEWAWIMTPVEPDDLPYAIPLLALYQGEESFTPRNGSPCFQTASRSVIHALVVCKKTELKQRLDEVRARLLGWQRLSDDQHLPLYLSDDPNKPCHALDIKGDYIWWQDLYFTSYPLLPMQF